MATKEKDTNKELEVEEIVSKSEQFIENNSKKIIYGIIAVALVVGAVLRPSCWKSWACADYCWTLTTR